MGYALSEQAMNNKKEYDKKYARENFQRKHIVFNKKDADDMALFEWINSQKIPATTYIKSLISADMAQRKKNV